MVKTREDEQTAKLLKFRKFFMSKEFVLDGVTLDVSTDGAGPFFKATMKVKVTNVMWQWEALALEVNLMGETKVVKQLRAMDLVTGPFNNFLVWKNLYHDLLFDYFSRYKAYLNVGVTVRAINDVQFG